MSRVLLFLYPGCIYRDVAEAVHDLHAVATIDIVGPKRGVIATADGVGIRATWNRKGVTPNVYDAALVPGGDLLEPLGDPACLQLLARLAARRDIVVGAIGTGVVLLGAAGLLRGRRIAHPLQPSVASSEQIATLGHYLEDAIDTDEDVVADGPLLTAVSEARGWFARAMVTGVQAVPRTSSSG